MTESKLTIIEHLNELRRRMIISLAALAVTTAISFPLSGYTLKIFKLPASGLIKTLAFFGPADAFAIHLRIALLSGLIIALPLILYQIWAFIAEVIEEKYRHYSFQFIAFCLVAFISGCLFCYFLLLPAALSFLLNFAKTDLVAVISAQKYISFVLGLMIGCALTFEMPVLSFILTKVGLINARYLRRKRKFAVLFIFITAAMITPTTDAFNLMILALPMLVLYEFSIYISRWTR
ncbi:MAG: twin-arginine translocase subunit TatC [Candidatus Omnitrophota bacterium]|nr:MAG: twin-arginine translocase subunit TatC [Candidatus Omnitrophota bacterium]